MAETLDTVVTEGKALPLGPYPRIVTKDFDVPGIDRIEVYRQHGGYTALATALRDIPPDTLAEEVKRSGLRGRGGPGRQLDSRQSQQREHTHHRQRRRR